MGPIEDKLDGLPTWRELLRMFPVSIWSAGLIALGWWARGTVDHEVIEHLLRLCAKG